MKAAAHVRQLVSGEFEVHSLEDHLFSVANLARLFAAHFSACKERPPDTCAWAELAGLWHDLGKYQPAFQKYIASASGMEAHIEAPGRVKHAIAGAIHAAEECGPYGRLLAYLIAGHHAGLPDWHPDEASGAALSQELKNERATLTQALAGGVPPEIIAPDIVLPKPPIRKAEEVHGWLRMLFSCLVDADFLDTEAFMDDGRNSLRGGYAEIPVLRAAYVRHMATRFANADTPVKQLRGEILNTCIERAAEAPGLFSMTVPTGGGKTLASLGFALHHAERYGQRRIIYVIPYTSIIEQTADVFCGVFDGIDPAPVIEHHSNLEAENETAKSRIASENWDAPIVVTTNVQFFESLYAARPSRCRKLHNIANSVVILDEAQLLPPEHLAPILDTLRQLIAHYGVTVVLSTATQPELHKTRTDASGRVQLQGLGEARELAPDPGRLYKELHRVNVTLPTSPEQRRSWEDIAGELSGLERVLCIVNRRDDAATLWGLLPAGTLHLSARMCGAHRAKVIAEIHRRLAVGEPVRVVSTQLVEAGVDLDFPVVYRAMAGLDSIAQAAGRCNREGRHPGKGRVVVFNPPKPSPSGLLLKAEQAAINVLAGSSGEPLTPVNYARYFDQFYGCVNDHDKEGVLNLLNRDAARGEIQFRTAAQRFRLIPDEGQRQIFVGWCKEGADLIELLKKIGPNRELLRKLQRYSVTLYEYQWKKLLASGDLKIHNDFIIQESEALYHPVLGLLPEVPDYTPKSLVV
ncbi:CRISPR-associated helicase Cas3 [Candidatus Propionivibrio aalborgensis]|uniref:CRISPR-associated helicase Cas3 n=1 Tax=Candidatus Propionivibrio aalborgensis TaxID=1860101 RepID=A0A1A8Y0M2_9RHOO|nr:CRISPR-associated helicase Cas3' [Candidatus Propionivibrio aalborgensis]MBK9026932.1 CRISPR-associated helicase Cas3' [Propionivibrio sp.]SBT10511.1 CRISPR-associated helicase Cas3 [Candidatus Propionivibrio aalborgensis]